MAAGQEQYAARASKAVIGQLEEFERGLDPRHPGRSRIPARILGYGEISTVIGLEVEGLEGLAFKRLPLFRDWGEVERYRASLEGYVRLLTQTIGLCLPRHQHAAFLRPSGRPVFYIIQDQMPAECIGHRALHHLPADAVNRLVHEILRELRKVWEFNQQQTGIQVAIDGQISNWAVDGFDPAKPSLEGTSLKYLDTSTPLFRVGGAEQLDPELFLRSAPSFLVWILRWLFLKDVVGRYYDFHRVAVDLVANFHKEQRPELIPGVVDTINGFFLEEAAGLGVQPLTQEEVNAYYREDALIWRLYLAMRKIDRALRTRLLRQEYPYILPERVQR